MRSIVSQILTIDTPKFAHKGEVWGVYCEFELSLMFCLCHSSIMC